MAKKLKSTEPKKISANKKLRDFLLENVGTVVTSFQLRDIAGGPTSWDRRVRELREKSGWKILTHNDTTELKPTEYLLQELPPETPVKFAKEISQKLRSVVYDRNGFTCQMCGLCPGELDPVTKRKVRLHLGHIKDRSLGGKDELSNLRALCSSCNQGAKNVAAEKPSEVWLLSQIRRAGQDEQAAVLRWLQKKFNQPSTQD